MRRSINADVLIVAGLLALPLVFFAPVTLGGKTLLPADNLFQFQPWAAYADELGVGRAHNPLLSDLILENYPWKLFIKRCIAGGELPLWTPHIFAGTPFLAGGQHSALYPFSVIFYVLPLPVAYGLFTVSQIFLAGLFMYMFTRSLGLRRAGAVLAAIAYQFSGFMIVRVVFPMVVASAAWLPFLLMCIEYVIRQRSAFGRPASAPWAVLGAIGLGMVILAGHPEMMVYTLLVMAFYSAARLVGKLSAERRLSPLARPVIWLTVMVVLGIGIGAVQLIPMVEAVRTNFREGGATLDQIRGWAYPVRRLIAFLMPNFFGNPTHHAFWDIFTGQVVRAEANAHGNPISSFDWGIKNYVEGGAYVGLLTLILAAIGLINAAFERDPGARYDAPGRPYRAIFAVLALLSLSFAFGTPLYALLYYGLPGISQLHTPFRWVFPFTLSITVLAGFGADALVRKGQPDVALGYDDPVFKVFTFRLAKPLGWGLIWGGVALIVATLLGVACYGQIEPLVERVFWGLLRAPDAFPDARTFFSYEVRNLLLLGAFLIATGIVIRVSRCPIYLPRWLRRRPVWELSAALVLTLDLFVAWWGFNPATDPALLDFRPPVVEWLLERDGFWRLTSYESDRGTFVANSGWIYGFEDIRGYDSIIQRRYVDYMELLGPQFQLLFNRIAPLSADHPESLDSPLLDLLNVRYVITEIEIDRPGYRLAYRDEAVRVYENTDAMPRAFTLPVSASVRADDFAAAIAEYDPRQIVIVEGEGGAVADEPVPAEPVPAEIPDYRFTTVYVHARVEEPSWLVLADSYFPGWRAFIRPADGDDSEEREIPIYPVDGNFRGVELPPGDWIVRFRYTPMSFMLGGFASFLAGVVLVAVLGAWLWRYIYGGDLDESTAHRVAKNSLAPIVLNLFNRGIDFAFAIIMLRILRPEGAGLYYYAIVIFGWFDILTNFGLNVLLTREVARRKDRASEYLLNSSLLRIALAALGVPLLAAFLTVRQSAVAPPLPSEALWAIALLYIGLVPNSISTGLTALFYAFEKAEYPAGVSTVSTILKAVFGVTVLMAGWGIVGLAGASIVTNVITLTILAGLARPLVGRFLPGGKPKLDVALWRYMLGESWALMLTHLLATIFFKIDVVLLEGIRSATVVGWYSTAYKWLDALNVIPAFFTQALLPIMSVQAREDRAALVRGYRLAVKILVMLALPIAVVTTFIATALVRVLGGPEYLPDGAIALQLMIWSIPIGWINSLTNYVLIALDRQRQLMLALVIGVTFNIGANLAFMPAYGYRAAAVITIFSELTLLIATYSMLRRLLEPIPWARMLWKPFVAAALMFGAMAMIWPVQPVLALGAGMVAYMGVLAALNPFEPHERARIEPLLRRVR